MSLEEVAVCPVCDKDTFRHHLTCKDHTSSGELFHVKQCEVCSLVLTSPRPSALQAGRYYQSEEYISHTSSSRGILGSIYLIVRYFTMIWKFNLVKNHLKGGPLLDFGSGTGRFLQYCKSKGIPVHGVEPSPEARKNTNADLDIADSLTHLPPLQFDVITLWHVLEHVYTLKETLEALRSRLSEDGTIFIAVPNWKSSDATHYKESWAAYDVPRHLWHFSKDSIPSLLNRSGLSIKEVLPMKLDAYYVSLLSEKYQRHGTLGVTGLLYGIYAGVRSNLRAKTDGHYSSLIYVVKKK